MPGLPYLRKLSLDYFKISVILSLRVLKYGNISQKSWKLNTRTFSFQASCANLLRHAKMKLTVEVAGLLHEELAALLPLPLEQLVQRLRLVLATRCQGITRGGVLG